MMMMKSSYRSNHSRHFTIIYYTVALLLCLFQLRQVNARVSTTTTKPTDLTTEESLSSLRGNNYNQNIEIDAAATAQAKQRRLNAKRENEAASPFLSKTKKGKRKVVTESGLTEEEEMQLLIQDELDFYGTTVEEQLEKMRKERLQRNHPGAHYQHQQAQQQPESINKKRTLQELFGEQGDEEEDQSTIDFDLIFPPSPFDLGFRFNKFGGFMDPKKVLATPLGQKDYPLTFEIVQLLRNQTNSESVVHQSDCEPVHCFLSIWRLIRRLGGLPSFPSSDPNAMFWKEMEEVTNVQYWRLQPGFNPGTIIPLPQIWRGRTMAELAEAVHDEFPGVNHVQLMEALLKEGVSMDRTMVPSRSKQDFLREEITLADINTWAIAKVGPLNFGIKWFSGRPRPEEVAWLITEGKIPKSAVPDKLHKQILDLGMTAATNYTAYPEGSPTHPSWPAMHSAGAAGSMWMAVVLNLTEAQYCEVLKLDYTVSYARTVAGVHYPTDNMAGLNLGQMIIARQLPFFLRQRFGARFREVRKKILKHRFKWESFLNSTCAQNSLDSPSNINMETMPTTKAMMPTQIIAKISANLNGEITTTITIPTEQNTPINGKAKTTTGGTVDGDRMATDGVTTDEKEKDPPEGPEDLSEESFELTEGWTEESEISGADST